MLNFKIESVSRNCSELVTAIVTMSFKEWREIVKASGLGSLYGIDISNHVYRTYGIAAFNPSVSVRKPKRGSDIVTIELTYADNEWSETPMGELIHVDFKARRRVA